MSSPIVVALPARPALAQGTGEAGALRRSDSYAVRLPAAFAAFLVVTALGMVLVSSEIRGMQQTRDAEVTSHAAYIADMDDVALTAKAMANDERGYLLTGQQKYADEALGRVVTIDASLTSARTHGGAERAGSVDAASAGIHRWADAVKQEFALSRTDPAAALKAALGPNRDLRKAYEKSLGEAQAVARKDLVSGTAFAASTRRATQALWAVLGVLLVVGVAMSVLLVRALLRPLRRAREVLATAAGGDLRARMDHSRRDEFGQLADVINHTLGSFEEVVGGISGAARTVADAAAELSAVNTNLSVTTQTVSGQSAAAAGAVDAVSRGVGMMAAGAEQMGASIREISSNASEAATVSQEAVTVAGSACETIAELGRSSSEIGNVVALITAIAEQTNLLALNATIEAARAGEAGKGFAVVATEVKDLAQQTARATEDISRRVGGIQSDAARAVDAIQRVSEVIASVSHFSTAIAGAVEEQTATTSELARSVAQVAEDAGGISGSVTEVARAASHADEGVAAATRAAADLEAMSGRLRALVSHFDR